MSKDENDTEQTPSIDESPAINMTLPNLEIPNILDEF